MGGHPRINASTCGCYKIELKYLSKLGIAEHKFEKVIDKIYQQDNNNKHNDNCIYILDNIIMNLVYTQLLKSEHLIE